MTEFLESFGFLFVMFVIIEFLIGVYVTIDKFFNYLWNTREKKSRKINPTFWKLKDEITQLENNRDGRFISSLKSEIENRENLKEFVSPHEREKQEIEIKYLKEKYYEHQHGNLENSHKLELLYRELKNIPDKWFNNVDIL